MGRGHGPGWFGNPLAHAVQLFPMLYRGLDVPARAPTSPSLGCPIYPLPWSLGEPSLGHLLRAFLDAGRKVDAEQDPLQVTAEAGAENRLGSPGWGSPGCVPAPPVV